MFKSYLAWPGAPLAIGSALLFGASTPFAKLLLGGGLNPWLMAALLYMGSGLGLAAIQVIRKLAGQTLTEAPIRRADLPWLGLVVLSGGVIGPVLLMVGLSTTSAASTALLLNLEGLATMAIAWLAFRENVDRRLLLGALAILAGAVLLSWQGQVDGLGLGALAVAGACLAWGVDNNLTRKLSSADPVQLSMIKGLVAGGVNLALALTSGAHLPALDVALVAGLIGFLGYGVSLVMFVLGLRHLGAARTGAYFSTAPFVGAAISLVLFAEPVTATLVLAGLLMAIGVWLHLAEGHEHEHTHEALEHEHRHVHDAHHQHSHGPDDPVGEPHSHPHSHEVLTHTHPHYPDQHHRHRHSHVH